MLDNGSAGCIDTICDAFLDPGDVVIVDLVAAPQTQYKPAREEVVYRGSCHGDGGLQPIPSSSCQSSGSG